MKWPSNTESFIRWHILKSRICRKQKKEAGEAPVSTVLFANDSTVIHDRLLLGEVPPLTEKEYFTCGCTALLDAVGGAIHHIGNIHKYARREDVPEKTMFIITTATITSVCAA